MHGVVLGRANRPAHLFAAAAGINGVTVRDMGQVNRTTRIMGLLLACTIVLSCAGGGRSEPFVDGLVAPRGLTALQDGSVLVSEVGGGRLLQVHPDGATDVLVSGLPTTLDSGPGGNYPSGLGAAIPHEDGHALLVGEFIGDRFARLYLSDADGNSYPLTPPASLDDPPEDRFSNPYDLVKVLDGWLVSDSGRNAVLRVTEDGAVSDYALFDRIELPADERFADAEVVPTGIALGPDGAVYVASLTGFPYPENEASVYRLEDSNLDGDAMDPGEVTVFATGFSAATDLAFDAEGSLLVTEFSIDMRRLVEEFGINNAEEVPGRLVRWDDGEITVIADDLVSPTSLAISGDRIYVSEEFAGRVIAIN